MRKAAQDFQKAWKQKQADDKEKEAHVAQADLEPKKLPGEIAMLFRVIMLLRGLCSTLEARVEYLQILAVYAQIALIDRIPQQLHLNRFATGTVGSPLEQQLVQVITANHPDVLGMQVSVYQHGKPIAEVCAGTISETDPRPVRPDTLFNVFSVTKAVIAAVVHTLVDQGELQLDSLIVDYWPEFAAAGSTKAQCTVAHALAHTAGLHNAIGIGTPVEDLCNFDLMLHQIEQAEPSNAPGLEHHYHYLSYGWLLGGVVQKVTQKPLAQIVRERVIEPLGFTEEFYMCTGLPQEVIDIDGKIAQLSLGLFSTPSGGVDVGEMMRKVAELQQKPQTTRKEVPKVPLSPLSFNMRRVRGANIPAANGHCSARSLAKFYATLAAGALRKAVLLLLDFC